MRRRLVYACPFLLLFFLLLPPAFGRMRLPAIIGHNMVLQRDKPVPIWGWASPSSVITVGFGSKSYTAVTGSDGKWSLTLDACTAGGPYNMQITSDSTSIVLDNILMGDVWLASGQSNMEYGIQTDTDAATEIPAATDSLIRFFFVAWQTSLESKADIADVPDGSMNGRWMVCSPFMLATTGWAWHGFSAVAYYFAQQLRMHVGSPIGLIGSYKGGTPAQAWVSLDGLKKDTALGRYVNRHQQLVTGYAAAQAGYGQKLAAYTEDLKKWNEDVGRPYQQAMQQWEEQAGNEGRRETPGGESKAQPPSATKPCTSGRRV